MPQDVPLKGKAAALAQQKAKKEELDRQLYGEGDQPTSKLTGLPTPAAPSRGLTKPGEPAEAGLVRARTIVEGTKRDYEKTYAEFLTLQASARPEAGEERLDKRFAHIDSKWDSWKTTEAFRIEEKSKKEAARDKRLQAIEDRRVGKDTDEESADQMAEKKFHDPTANSLPPGSPGRRLADRGLEDEVDAVLLDLRDALTTANVPPGRFDAPTSSAPSKKPALGLAYAEGPAYSTPDPTWAAIQRLELLAMKQQQRDVQEEARRALEAAKKSQANAKREYEPLSPRKVSWYHDD